jgi:hypothetical protein
MGRHTKKTSNKAGIRVPTIPEEARAKTNPTHLRSKTSGRPPAIHLVQTAKGQVVIHAGDDLFLLTVQEAVNACGAWHEMAEFQSQMKELMEYLSKWISARMNSIRDAYFSVKTGGGLLFMVVTKTKKFDAELENELTDLDIQVANAPEYNLLRLSVLAIPDSPPECVESFLTNC